MDITKNTKLESIIDICPDAVGFLFEKGIVCIACGEPVWDTLGEAAAKKNISEEDLSNIIIDLKKMMEDCK